jgi:hypothetical protein
MENQMNTPSDNWRWHTITDQTPVAEITRKLEMISDEALVSRVVYCAEILELSGNPHAAAYILSLPRDNVRFTAQHIRNTLRQQVNVNCCPAYIQFEVYKRRNDYLDARHIP